MPIIMLSQNELLIDDFSGQSENSYRIVNDGVMGGRSESDIARNDDGHAEFSGYLSLENNGGFASVRIILSDNLSSDQLAQVKAIRMKVKGDGRKYSFRIRTNNRFDGVSYTQNFQTKADEWIEVELPITDFRPSFRGRYLPDVPALDPSTIRQLGVLLGDKKQGDFQLQMAWVKGVLK